MVMKGLISQPQGAFIEGCQILDSALVVNECIEDRLWFGWPGVLCKLDAEKAYDHVNWNLLDHILSRLGFRMK